VVGEIEGLGAQLKRLFLPNHEVSRQGQVNWKTPGLFVAAAPPSQPKGVG
jgi:hypothetical protein